MKRTNAVVALASLAFSVSCGARNALSERAPDNLQEAAELDMEAGSRDRGRYAAAQEKLEALLAEEPGNHVARSLLAASHAAQAGVVLLTILTRLSMNAASLGTDAQALLWDSFPSPNDESLERMRLAVETMGEIPVDSLTPEMTYQKGIFLTALAVLTLKKLLQDLQTLGSLSPDGAETALSTLVLAVETAGGASTPLGGAINAVLSAIQERPGATSQDKVQDWLGRMGR